MQKLLVLFCFLTSTIAAQSPQQFTKAEAQGSGFSAERLNRISTYFNEKIAEGICPNAAVFIAKDGKIVFQQAYGFSNLAEKKKLKNTDIFRIASQTKLLTTICVLMLMEEGKCHLDEPISKYIPAFKNPQIVSFDENRKMNLRPAKNAITIRHLLSHNAGIPYEHPMDTLGLVKVPHVNSLENDVLEDVVNKIASRPLVAEPGTKFVYGLNTDVLGRLVEILSAQPFNVFMQKRLLDPLGLKDTHFYLPSGKISRLVELYEKGSEKEPLVLSKNNDNRTYSYAGAKTYFSGGAGLVSTIEDYAKICQLILNKGSFNNVKILSRKTVESMGVNNIGEDFVWDRKDKFGLGLEIATENSHYMDLASPGALSWGGMYCSEYTIDPKENLIMLMFTNVHPYAHYAELTRKFRILTYQALK